MRHDAKLVSRKDGEEVWRCSCGHEFRSEDDADEHAANARAEEPRDGRR